MSQFRCEDYPCCGHGDPPLGDGGGCPNEEGRFKCVGLAEYGGCSTLMPSNASSSLCDDCQRKLQWLNDQEQGFYDGPDDEDSEDEDSEDEDAEADEEDDA